MAETPGVGHDERLVLARSQELDDDVHVGNRTDLQVRGTTRSARVLDLEQVDVPRFLAESLTEIGLHLDVFEKLGRVLSAVVGLALRWATSRDLPGGDRATCQKEEQDQPPEPSLWLEQRIDPSLAAAERRLADPTESPIPGPNGREVLDQGLPDFLRGLVSAIGVLLEAT